jgi:hypothetical protein
LEAHGNPGLRGREASEKHLGDVAGEPGVGQRGLDVSLDARNEVLVHIAGGVRRNVDRLRGRRNILASV